MYKYIIKRLIYTIITLLGVSVIVFSILHLIPGDPIQLMFGKNPDPELIAILRSKYALDLPIYKQYFIWMKNVIKLDLGNSIMLNIPVRELVIERLGRSLLLTICGISISMLITIPAGIISAWRHNTYIDLSVTTFTLVLISIPEFWLGILFMIIFAVKFHVLPSSGYVLATQNFKEFISHLILPSITLGGALTAVTTRMLRGNLLEVLEQDYIFLNKAYGIKNFRVLLFHALRNALIPVITALSLQIGYVFGGSIIIERVFNYPGLGSLLLKSLSERDYPVVQVSILVYATMFIFINFFVDIIYSYINPKITLK